MRLTKTMDGYEIILIKGEDYVTPQDLEQLFSARFANYTPSEEDFVFGILILKFGWDNSLKSKTRASSLIKFVA